MLFLHIQVLLTFGIFFVYLSKGNQGTMGNRINKIGKWINSGGHRTYIYDVPRNQTETLDLRQSRCEYDKDTKVVRLQYYTDNDNWISEQHSRLQMQRYMRTHITPNKMLVQVDNAYAGKKSGKTTRFQVLWLSKEEPSEEQMKSIEERIMEMQFTAPIKVEEMNYYQRMLLTGTTKEDDGTLKPVSDEQIEKAQECGFF